MRVLERLHGTDQRGKCDRYECRNCGQTVSETTDECPTCGSTEIACFRF